MIENANVCIKVDTVIKTDILVQFNRPDIVVYDKNVGKITIIGLELHRRIVFRA